MNATEHSLSLILSAGHGAPSRVITQPSFIPGGLVAEYCSLRQWRPADFRSHTDLKRRKRAEGRRLGAAPNLKPHIYLEIAHEHTRHHPRPSGPNRDRCL